MNQKQCGRNMLITDYLWIAYCESLPPGTLPDPKMKRHRKQVSSHIQVLKGFFRHHPMCKFALAIVLSVDTLRRLTKLRLQTTSSSARRRKGTTRPETLSRQGR